MKTLHKYLIGQVLASLLLTVAVFVFVLLLGIFVKEILDVLVKGQVRPGIIFEAIGLLIPFVSVYALPMGLLTATLLVFGRFSADQELTAARASGISLLSLITPVLLLSLFCCVLSAWINMDLGPRSRVAYINLIFKIRAELVSAQLPEGQPIYNFPGYTLMIGTNRDGNLQGVKIWKLENETNASSTYISAPRGRLEVDAPNKQLSLQLFNPRSLILSKTRTSIQLAPELTLTFILNTATNQISKLKPSDMTFWRLRNELRDCERQTNLPPVTALTTNELSGELREFAKLRNDYMERIRVEMNREVAFSFACFGFTLIGIPLGIRMHRRETNVGIAMALVLVLVYYSFIITAESLSARPELAPHLILWLPNFIFQAAGAVLLWRANRGI